MSSWLRSLLVARRVSAAPAVQLQMRPGRSTIPTPALGLGFGSGGRPAEREISTVFGDLGSHEILKTLEMKSLLNPGGLGLRWSLILRILRFS